MTRVATHGLSMTNRVVNPVLVPLLRSRWGARPGRRLAVVEYAGRRTGRRHRLVTQYSLDGPRVRIHAGAAEHKTWWRNFADRAPVRLRLAGVEHAATAVVVSRGRDVVVEAVLDDRRA